MHTIVIVALATCHDLHMDACKLYTQLGNLKFGTMLRVAEAPSLATALSVSLITRTLSAAVEDGEARDGAAGVGDFGFAGAEL